MSEDKARAAAAEDTRVPALVSNTELFEFGVQLRARKDKRFAKVELRSVERDWLLDKMKRRSAETDRLLDKIEASLASLKFAV